MTDASESIDLQEGLRQSAAGETVSLGSFAKYADDVDLAELEKFTDQWANNPHNGDTIYSLAWMEGPESARTEASATLTVSGLRELIARVREAEARIEKVLNHDPLHGAESGLHCGGMSPCIRRILTEGDEQ